ncbi:MAG: hypothetical protein HXL70_08170 [Dialister invisus]|uniref:Uncharacterized protein n=1 Tax=Dialister invisus TaxID=218538 RepID=A0A930B6Z1_9FIRM|nr:hypothetical protein [Dialister invisus]
MHKKSPTGGEDTLNIPFLIVQEGSWRVKQKASVINKSSTAARYRYIHQRP